MVNYQSGEIATITLNAPERHNALSHEDFTALGRILDHIEKEKPRVVILTGEGKSFCSGVDFESLQEGNWANDNPLNWLCERVAALPMPVIAALNGHFVGGGAELAFAADFRIAVPNAKCKVPAAAIGVHYEPSGIARIVSVVGLQISRRLFLGLESFSGEDLLAFNFIDMFADDPLQQANKRAEEIAALAPLALAGMKKSLGALRDDKTDEGARERIANCFASGDFAEAMQAIREKRKPDFKGK